MAGLRAKLDAARLELGAARARLVGAPEGPPGDARYSDKHEQPYYKEYA